MGEHAIPYVHHSYPHEKWLFSGTIPDTETSLASSSSSSSSAAACSRRITSASPVAVAAVAVASNRSSEGSTPSDRQQLPMKPRSDEGSERTWS